MSDAFVHDDNLVASALRQNWEHARHIEGQRIQFMAVYVAIGFGLGFVATHPGDPFVRIGAALLAFCITLIVWAITYKLGLAFANQIRHADRCARRLAIQTLDGNNEYIALHDYIGFPRKPPAVAGVLLTVRQMFSLFYATCTLAWAVFAGYLMFLSFTPAANL